MFVFDSGGRRPDSILISILCIALGIPLVLYPGVSGRLFCLALAAGALIYAAARGLRYLRGRRQGWTYAGDKVLAILFAVIGLFCLFFWRSVLSFLPMLLGLILLLSAFGRLPLALDAWQMRLSGRTPLLVSTALPFVLGLVLLLNPFGVTRLVIQFFGLGLIADGICALAAAISARRR